MGKKIRVLIIVIFFHGPGPQGILSEPHIVNVCCYYGPVCLRSGGTCRAVPMQSIHAAAQRNGMHTQKPCQNLAPDDREKTYWMCLSCPHACPCLFRLLVGGAPFPCESSWIWLVGAAAEVPISVPGHWIQEDFLEGHSSATLGPTHLSVSEGLPKVPFPYSSVVMP